MAKRRARERPQPSPEYDQARSAAEQLRALVALRIECEPKQIECPREKSHMTPCIARDGGLAVDNDGMCVGCGESARQLLSIEREKHR